jgi:hypothetical protein
MGLRLVGPAAVRPAGHPWPTELPEGSRRAPTSTAASKVLPATRQLDFVFASKAIADHVTRNGVDEWGPSDHCGSSSESNSRPDGESVSGLG